MIFTIHQPRSDTFKRFDHIFLLTRGGQSVYVNKGELVLRCFFNLGYQCPETTNAADFALDLITVDLQHSMQESISRDRVLFLVSQWADKTSSKMNLPPKQTIAHLALPGEVGSLKRAMTPLRVALPLLLRRSSINLRRNPATFDARIAQVLGFAIIVTLFWAPLCSNYEGVQNRVGFIHQQQMGGPDFFLPWDSPPLTKIDQARAVFYRDASECGVVSLWTKRMISSIAYQASLVTQSAVLSQTWWSNVLGGNLFPPILNTWNPLWDLLEPPLRYSHWLDCWSPTEHKHVFYKNAQLLLYCQLWKEYNHVQHFFQPFGFRCQCHARHFISRPHNGRDIECQNAPVPECLQSPESNKMVGGQLRPLHSSKPELHMQRVPTALERYMPHQHGPTGLGFVPPRCQPSNESSSLSHMCCSIPSCCVFSSQSSADALGLEKAIPSYVKVRRFQQDQMTGVLLPLGLSQVTQIFPR